MQWPRITPQPAWCRPHGWRRISTIRISGSSNARPGCGPPSPDAGVPYHPEAGRADYEAGHIPGAGFLDLPGELSRQDAAVHFMMLPAAEFAEVMSRHGIGEGTRVGALQPRSHHVGDAGLVDAARDGLRRGRGARWRLRAVAGGRPPGQRPRPRPIRRRRFVPRPRPGADGRQGRGAGGARRPGHAADQHAVARPISRARSRAATAARAASRAASTCPGRR